MSRPPENKPALASFVYGEGARIADVAAVRALMRFCLLCFCLALLPGWRPALAAPSTVERTGNGNSYYAGGELTISDAVQGDLFAAGGRVTVTQPVGADAAVAGGAVEVRSAIAQDLRAAGGNVEIAGAVGGELVAAGGTVRIAEGTTVSGPSLLTGGEVIVNGRLLKGAKIYARRISLGGEIDGDTRFYAQEIVFGPNARIDGNLYYASQAPLPEEQLAKVSGQVVREKTQQGQGRRAAGDRGGISWFHPVFFLSMLASGFVLYLLFPNAVRGVRESIAGAPLRSAVIGLALLFTLPPVALLLMLTVIGIPIGLGLFALYPLLLMLGYLAAAFFIGRKLADAVHAAQPPESSKRKQALFLAAALLLLGIAGAIPVLGWLFVFLCLVAGIGGWAIWLAGRYRGSPPPAPDTDRRRMPAGPMAAADSGE